jgi:hypothetical protein
MIEDFLCLIRNFGSNLYIITRIMARFRLLYG